MSTLTRILQLAALGCACAASIEAHAAATPAPDDPASAVPTSTPQATGLRRRRAYLAGSPGVLGFALSGYSTLPAVYLWGIEGGTNFPIGRTFLVQAGGFFEHSPFRHSVSGPQGSRSYMLHWLRLGPQVRIGGGNERAFGYALLSLVVDVLVTRSTASGGDGVRRGIRPFPHGSIGGGVQGLIGRKLLLGGEANLDAGLLMFLRLRLYVGVMF